MDNSIYPSSGKGNLKMEFKEKQGIYLQIAEYVCEQILLKEWPMDTKIPSVRDLAVLMEVNPNTVQRAYDFLQQKEIIINKRGVGSFVPENAMDKIINFRREQFLSNELEFTFRNMYLLKIGIDEINKRFEKYVNENFKDK